MEKPIINILLSKSILKRYESISFKDMQFINFNITMA